MMIFCDFLAVMAAGTVVMSAQPSDSDLTLQSVRAAVRTSDGWADVTAALDRREAANIDGAWGSSAAAAAAALADGRTAPILIVVPHLTDVGPWREDLTSFTGVRPVVFPAFETWPPPDRPGKVSAETGERLRVLQNLASRGGQPPRK